MRQSLDWFSVSQVCGTIKRGIGILDVGPWKPHGQDRWRVHMLPVDAMSVIVSTQLLSDPAHPHIGQESRFPCVSWKGFPAFPAHLRMSTSQCLLGTSDLHLPKGLLPKLRMRNRLLLRIDLMQ